jgi:hypothetical protein
MKKIMAILLLSGLCSSAQNKAVQNVAKQTTVADLKTTLYYLASKELNGRRTSSRGDTLASLYVANSFKRNHLVAPYKNYFQPVPVERIIPVVSNLSIGGKQYEEFKDWDRITYGSSIQAKDVPVVFVGYGDDDKDFEGVNVKGKAVLFLNGSPSANLTTAAKVARLKEKGAFLAIRYGDVLPKNQSVRDFVNSSYNPDILPLFIISEDLANVLLTGSNTSVRQLETISKQEHHSFVLNKTITVSSETKLKKEQAPNVIGYIRGTDTSAACVIVSAHHDHCGGEGNEIYYGAVDNASGTVALMQMAALMDKAVQKRYRPKRAIVFASFTGEEAGLLGSYYYADHPVFPVEKTFAVMNIDMMGRVDTFYSGKRADSNYAYILVKDTLNRGLRQALYNANDSSVRLHLDTYYEQPAFTARRLMGSDQYPLYLKGVPFLRIDCGFSTDYHKPTDTPDKINYSLLSKQVQLAFLTLWNIANN